jgi:hypothetical protein
LGIPPLVYDDVPAAVDPVTAMGTGQLVMVDKGDSHSVFRLSGDSLVESLTDQIERGCDEDFPALGVSGVFPADGLAPHELVLGDLIRRFPLTALCPYLIGGLSDSELLTVNALHDTQMRVWERAAHCRRIPHSVPRGRDERVAARPPAGVGPTVEDVQPRAVHGHGLRPRLRRGRRSRRAGSGMWVARRFCDQLSVWAPPAGGCTVRLSTGR